MPLAESQKGGRESGDVLRLENISIGFDSVPVLKNVSLSLALNEIHGIVGKNGAGKSTLMKILTGVYSADEGSVTLFDTDVTGRRSRELLQRGLSMVYQDLSLVPTMTVAQNVFLSEHPFKRWGFLNDRRAGNRVREILTAMGVDFISPNALVKDLSAGEAQLVEIAKALANKPRIIVFDEPTASLSNIETAQLFRTIRTLKGQGLSIIYITHYLEDVMKLCDRVSVLRDGKVAAAAAVADTSIPQIVGHMLGEERSALGRTRSGIAQSIPGPPAIRAENAETENVGPVSFYVGRGEIVGLAGLLGSGRTEILRMIFGLDGLSGGSIELNGRPVHFNHPHQAGRLGIALVPEERRTQGLVLDFSVEHNMSLEVLDKLKRGPFLDRRKYSENAADMIAKLQVKTTGVRQPVRFLSGGNQQKVVFGKCLAGTPSVLLLDDPTFGVDVHAKAEIMRIIESFAADGNSVVLVSSELGEIAEFCDRTYIVKRKRIVNEIENKGLTENELLKTVQ